MQDQAVVVMLAALAQTSRLAAFRLLVAAGPQGLAAGRIGEQLGLPPATLSFHLKALSQAGLVQSRTAGRFVVYAVDFTAMNALLAYLAANCCAGADCLTVPACAPADASATPGCAAPA